MYISPSYFILYLISCIMFNCYLSTVQNPFCISCVAGMSLHLYPYFIHCLYRIVLFVLFVFPMLCVSGNRQNKFL